MEIEEMEEQDGQHQEGAVESWHCWANTQIFSATMQQPPNRKNKKGMMED